VPLRRVDHGTECVGKITSSLGDLHKLAPAILRMTSATEQ
jgi:hypothetical protein